MKGKIFKILSMVLAFVMTSCCIHQWPGDREPDVPKPEGDKLIKLHLHFDPDMFVWPHAYDKENRGANQMSPEVAVIPEHPGTTDIYDNTIAMGHVKHIVRIYPSGDAVNYISEIETIQEIKAGYECEIELELPAGLYDIAVWSDPVNKGDSFFHDPSNFLSVSLNSNHCVNSDSQDAFRGMKTISVEDIDIDQIFLVEMKRPYSKYELIANDLRAFIEKESIRYTSSERVIDKMPDITEYKVYYSYPSYMPYSYSVIDDRLVDSKAGQVFESRITKINDEEATLGFHYILINAVSNVGDSQGVAFKLWVVAPDGKEVASSATFTIPLRRDNHTVIRGEFLTEESQGGVVIDPDYDGDHNVEM